MLSVSSLFVLHSSFFTLRSSLLKSFQESLGDLEGTLSHFCPEVEVLLSLGVLERHIADDAEGDEGSLIDVTGLSNGTALHIHSHSLWEMVEDGAHLLLAVYKPLSADYLSGMNLRVDVAWIVIYRECFLYIFRWCGKGGGIPRICPKAHSSPQ